MLDRHGWPRTSLFPHGGNQMSLAIAGGFGLGGAESYPGVFGVFGGFADDAAVEDGYLRLSERPGIGFEGQAALYRIIGHLAASLAAGHWPASASRHRLLLRQASACPRKCRHGREIMGPWAKSVTAAILAIALSQSAADAAEVIILTNQGAVPGVRELAAGFARASGHK